ncbi:killer cell lectin-like receptor subfamily F member 1 [Mya arenaria]|uniref:killer cell lectin-like receptor subfamily F member 1 n=1 Tax=Mya arenaria TaxID=6604 RepID=UPI0022E161ED|nr:killer cell lectin-like receptor subfamily F member 1 [Mya arenaria]
MYAFAAGQVITMNVAGRIRFHGTINISNPTAWVEYVSFYVCVDECKLRSSCSAVNYHRFYNLCQLNLEPNPRVIPTNERGLLYWIKTAPEDSVECGIHSCKPGSVCNIQTNECEVKECSSLPIANNTITLGNVNAIGAKVKMRCKEGFVSNRRTAITLTCGKSGSWSSDPLICLRDCPNGWLYNEGFCYFFGQTPLSFAASKSFCKISGGHLVYINDASENTFIKDKARQMTPEQYWWIGITNNAVEGVWTMIDGSEVTFTDWDIREPNGDGDCAHLMYQYDFQWNDISCTTQYQLYPICEK